MIERFVSRGNNGKYVRDNGRHLMQRTDWVKINIGLPDDGEPVLLIRDGEVLAGVYILEWNFVEGEMQWFLDDVAAPIQIQEADYWMYLRDLPMPEGEFR